MRSSVLLQLLSNRNYAIYTAGNAFSLIGTWIQSIAFGWLVWGMTGSPFWLGVVAAAGLIPTLAGGLIGGVLADRANRLRLTAMTQFLSFAVTFALFLCYRWGVLGLALLILFKVSLSALAAFSQPARMALIPSLVGRDQIVPAVSFGAMVFNTARFIGPALAGLIIAVGDIGWAFLINAASFFAMGVAVLSLRLERIEPFGARGNDSMLGDLGASLTYLARHPGPRILFMLLLAVVLFARPITDFFPAVATDFYGLGIEAVATLTASMALGSIAGGFWAVGRKLKGLTASGLTACGAYAGFIFVFMNVWSFWLGALLLVLAGFCSVLFVTAAQTLIQVWVEEGMRGRVLSLWFILSRGGPDLGALIMGTAAQFGGLANAFMAGAALCLGVTLWAFSRHSELARSFEAPAPQDPAPQAPI